MSETDTTTMIQQKDLDAMLEKRRSAIRVSCRMLRPLAGGQPAGEAGLRAFVQHQMGLEPDTEDFEAAVKRIGDEEIGEKDTTPESGEVSTKKVYSVNVIRSSEKGCFIAQHQIKAMLKQAASRMGLFVSRRGSKGDVAELGTVEAFGPSRLMPLRPWEVYLVNESFEPIATQWHEINGSVSTAQGKKSIQTQTEVAPEGSRFEFVIRWPANKLKSDDMFLVLAAATKIGIGSVLSLDYGRFEVLEAESL